MMHHRKPSLGGRSPNRLHHINALARAEHARRGLPLSNRARGEQRNLRLPFVPPEDWHEPSEETTEYRILVQSPGRGFRHILTPAEITARLSMLPEHFVEGLEVVQLSRMTRKKQSFPCYGMQWGASLYLYPIEESLVEYYSAPPKPSQVNEARMYGGRWLQEVAECLEARLDRSHDQGFLSQQHSDPRTGASARRSQFAHGRPRAVRRVVCPPLWV